MEEASRDFHQGPTKEDLRNGEEGVGEIKAAKRMHSDACGIEEVLE